jgi:hypothetical protein
MEEFKDKVFIVKVPELIYNNIIKSREKDFGLIDVIQNQNGEKELNINLYNGEVKKFSLGYAPTDSYFTFSDKNLRQANYFGRFISADQEISDRVTKKVMDDEEKNKLKIERDYAKGRQNNESIIKLSNFQYIAANDTYQKARDMKIRKEKNLKKTRKDKEDLKTEIFDLFSEKKYWTNRELVAKLDQPENYLKEVLSEICNYIKSGPKKGCYGLKEQYINVQDEKD